MSYSKEIHEFVKVRIEQSPSDMQVARDVRNKFNLDQTLDAIRKFVYYRRDKLKHDAQLRPQKRLFFDIETGYYILKIRAYQLKNYKKYFDPKDIVQEKQILCISYKWQYEDEVHTLDWRNGEKEMLKAFIKIMGEADECIGHNGDNFDIKEIRTRCLYYGILMFPNYRTLDTLKKARKYFRFASNKLDYIGTFLGVGGKLQHEGFQMWIDIVEGDKETSDKALMKMIEYCERDVIVLEDSFYILSPFIDHNNNFAALSGGDRWDCPECAGKDVLMFRTYSTPMGTIRREMKCNSCKSQYKVSNRTYMNMLISLSGIGSLK